MKLPDITAWLASGRDFAPGAALYAALGSSATYKRLFALGPNDYAHQVLVRELSALVPPAPAEVASEPSAEPPAAPVPAEVASEPPPEPDAAPDPAPLGVPVAAPLELPSPAPVVDAAPQLEQLAQQLKALRDQRSHLHPQLTGKNVGKKARGQVALQIVAITAQEGHIRALEAHVQRHGRLPGPVPTADVVDEVELRRRLLTLRSRRSKLKKQPDKAEKLAEVEAEILLITSKLA